MLLNRRRGFIAIAAIASLLLLADLHSGGYVRGAWNRSLSHPYSSAEEFPGALAERIFNFTWDKPAWLTDPLPAGAPPTRFRVAFISHPAEADRRQAVRELLLADLPADEVIVDHLFFAGTDNNTDHDAALRAEADEMKDVRIVDLFEKKDHLSRKRFDAFLWAADAPGEYDYFVTADVDSFIRFRAFARRLRAARPDLDPRVHRISWGWQLHHWWHWKAGVEDEENPGFDVRYDGEWYRYPSGMMYVLSKALTSALRANSDKLAHRILYACDDVMIGSWIKETSPSTTDSDVPFGNATGALYAKKPKDEAGNEITLETTHIVNDEAGVHDPLEHGWKPYPVDWDTVCAHHLNIAEMRGLRYRPEFESEWMKPGKGEVPEGLTLDQ